MNRRKPFYPSIQLKLVLVSLLALFFYQASAQDAKPLSLWVMGNASEGTVSYFDTVLPMFANETGVSVEYEFVPWGDAVQRISTAVMSGQGPDVTQVGTTRVPGFQATGGFVDLTNDYGDTLPAKDAFFPSTLQTIGYAGKAYSAPWFSDPRILIYRKDLWGEAGYPEGPKTWEELVDGGVKIKDAHPELASVIGLPGQDFGHYLGEFIWQNCGDILSPDGTKVTWTAPEVVEAVKFFADLVAESGVAAPQNAEWTYDDVLTRFWDGSIGTLFFGSDYNRVATSEQITAMNDNIGFALEPTGRCQSNFVGGSNLMMFEGGAQQDASLELISFLQRPDIQAFNTNLGSHVPVVRATFADSAPENNPELWTTLAEATEVGRTFPVHPAWSDVQQTIPEVVTRVYAAIIDGSYNATTVDQILTEVEAEGQRALDAAGGAPAGYDSPWPTPTNP
ncbi:sugar ABC transporter substrate-binding protein [soil metagenome]